MKQRYHQSLSAGNIELPLLSTLMGNPHRDWLAHLIKCSEPHRQIIYTRGTSMTENPPPQKNLLFKPEPGQFVLWLSRQWSALNPYEDCAAEGPRWTPNHTVKMRTCKVSRLRWRWGGPPVRDVWHLIFLTMKDDTAVTDANFFQMEKNAPRLISRCTCAWQPFYSELWWIFITNIPLWE